MKKLFATFTVLLVLLSAVFPIKAGQDHTDINIESTFVDFLNFTGSAANSIKYYSINDIQPINGGNTGAILPLGTLGLESNYPGDCDIRVSAKNNFTLRRTQGNQRLTHFRLRWKGEVFSGNRARTNELTIPCNSPATDITFQQVAFFLRNPRAGIYQDIVTFTVTTQ